MKTMGNNTAAIYLRRSTEDDGKSIGKIMNTTAPKVLESTEDKKGLKCENQPKN